MLSNQKYSRFNRAKGLLFGAIALALLMSVTAFASGNSRFAFIDGAAEFFGLSKSAPVAAASLNAPAITMMVPCANPGGGTDQRSVSLPVLMATPGIVQVPITVGDLTNCNVNSYDFNVDYTASVLTPASSVVTGTLSEAMAVTPNTSNAGHLIISGFQAAALCDGSDAIQTCVGGETLLILRFNVIGAGGSSSPLTFADYTDPASAFHPAFTFNEGDPIASPVTAGSVSVPAATATNTDTPTPSATNTSTATNTATNTNTPTPSNTATATFTPSNTSTPTPTPLCAQIDIEDKTVTSGSSVTLAVNTSDTTTLSPPALSADFHISFDNTVLTEGPFPNYGVSLGPVGLSNGASLTVNHSISGSTTTLFISVYGDSPFSGAGSLVDINFPVVTGAPGTFSPVNFSPFSLNGIPVPGGFWYNEGSPTSCLQNGSVQILGTVGGRILYDNTKPGAPLTRPVPGVIVTAAGSPAVACSPTDADGYYNCAGFGAGLYTVSFFRAGFSAPNTHGSSISAYDAAITAQNVVQLIPFTPLQIFVAKVTGDTTVSSNDAALMAKWAVNLAGTGFTGDWRFSGNPSTYNAPANYVNQDHNAYLMGDPSGNWCDPSSTVGPQCQANGTIIGQARGVNGPERLTNISAPKMEAPAGGEVVVPVSIQGVENKGIIAYQFDLKYDQTVIQPTTNAVTLAGTASEAMQVVFNATTPGVLKVAVYGPYALINSGALLNFHFNAVGQPFTSSSLTWDNFILNDGSIRMNILDGSVNLTPAVANPAQAD